MKKDSLKKYREMINELDNQLLKIIDKRSHLVSKIGKLKNKETGIVDPQREKSIIDRLLKKSEGLYSKDSIVRIWRELFHASTLVQSNNDNDIKSKRGINLIKIYEGGKSSVPGIKSVIKLSSNENNLGASNKIKAVLKKFKNLNTYPEINGLSLRESLSRMHNINTEQIILGNGSDEILLMSALAFCQPGDEVIHAKHSFEMYPIIAKIVGAKSIIAEEINYKLNIISVIKNISDSTKLIFIANPNNPTGTYLNKDEIIYLLKNIPKNVILVLDCAYSEYVLEEDYDKNFELVSKFKNLILTRTFSKVYGLAALRIGWCYTSKEIAKILNKIKPPFNTNLIAQKIASEVIGDKQHLKYVVNENLKNKKWFENELSKLGIKTLETFANFTVIKASIKETKDLNNLLYKNGIIVRKLDSYGLKDCLRITIGKKQEMKKVIKVLENKN